MSDRTEELDHLSKQYKNLTGINIKFELYAPTAAYTSKVRSAAQADMLPDIYGVLLEMRDYASFIKANHVMKLTEYIEENNGEWKDIFYESGLAFNTFTEGNQYDIEPGIYGVPLDINNIQMIYNLDLLERAGWDTSKLPSTWDEFMRLGKMLNEAGIRGLVSGWGETWMIHCFADNLAWNILGEEDIIATIRGEIPYTDPRWIKLFDLFKQMTDNNMFYPGSVTMVNKEAEQIFATGRAAMAFNGSWCVNVYEGMNPDLNYAVALPPRVNLERPMYIWGGTTSFVINNKSEMKEEAVAFLKWLTDSQRQDFLAERTNNIPANVLSSATLEGPLKQFAESMENVVHPRFLPYEEFPLVTEAFDKGIQYIMIGEYTPEQVAFMVEDRKQKELQKAERFRRMREKR